MERRRIAEHHAATNLVCAKLVLEPKVEAKSGAALATVAGVKIGARRPRGWTLFALLLAGSAAALGIGMRNPHSKENARGSADALSVLRPAAKQFAREAELCVEKGDWAGADRQWQFGQALTPERSYWECRRGEILLMQCDFPAALAAFRSASRKDAASVLAADGVVLCERLQRARETREAPSASAVYSVYRLLMKHGNLAEAVGIAARLPGDPELQRRTWEARLRQGGMEANVNALGTGRFAVTLRGHVQEHLTLMRGMPVVSLDMSGTDVADLAPLHGLPLETLDISKTPVRQIEVLHGMPLTELNLSNTEVENLHPIREAKLQVLNVSWTPVSSLYPLLGSSIKKLNISHTRVASLAALSALPIKNLDISGTLVSQLGPLAHLPLSTLRLQDTPVADLTPLRGAQLSELSVARTPVTDLEPLTASPIAVLNLSGCRELWDIKPLSKMSSLQKLTVPAHIPANEARAMLPAVRFIE